ncbi:MAG TPA: signal peptidase I [Peptococcaceae bacterium]|nr:signal peptidase I [Peptococcaceae bacterium]
MKVTKKILNITLAFIVIVLITAAIGSALTKKPFLLTSVRSNSMYPLFERGDILFLSPIPVKDNLQIGDIIIFKTESGSLVGQGWIAHRIVGGNKTDGYLTKGDANEYPDQVNQEGLIKPEWISSKVITIFGKPLKLPLLGHLPLLAEKYQKNPYVLPVIALILAIAIAVSEMTGNRKKAKKSNTKYELALMYFLGGLTLSVLVGTTMVATSEHIRMPYEVSEISKGAILGSNVGVLQVGDTIERPLSDLENKGFFPITVIITSNDKQITFNHESIYLKSGQQLEIVMKVSAIIPGKYEAIIHLGMFFPVLPKALITFLASINYWLAVGVVSLIPGLPLMLYPLWDKRMRRSVMKEFNKSVRHIRNSLPVV